MLENAGMTFRDSRRRRDQADLLDNPKPGFNGLMLENQAFSMSAIQAFGTAGVGVGIGLAVADFLDRFVATRKPSNGVQPWFGANAAAAQNRRPDAWRLGAQLGGGVGAIGLAYLSRGRSFLPWLFGGTAVGFFANLTKQLINWWAMPMVFRVQNPTEATLANRLYALEQRGIQDSVDAIFDNWQANAALAANQAEPPVVPSVAPGSGRSLLGARGAQMLGKGRTQAEVSNGRAGQPVLVPTGRLGMCDSCGGHGGCFSHCEDLTLCGDCPETVARRCQYTVQSGDVSIHQLVATYGIDIVQVNALNPPGDPNVYWVAGNSVVLPFALCRALEAQPVPSALPPPGLYPPVAVVAPVDVMRQPAVIVPPAVVGDPPSHSNSVEFQPAAGMTNMFRDED